MDDNRNDHKKEMELCVQLRQVIEESGCTFGNVESALKWLLVAYRDRADEVARSADILDVAARQHRHFARLPTRDDIERLDRDQDSK